jgi:polyisoprenoid-binding protein YceI
MSTASAVALNPNTTPNVAAGAQVSAWDFDAAHSSAGFKVRHMMVAKVRGHLGPISGRVVIDEQDLARSRVDVSIDARGIDTREAKRDEHLRSADFLDVANYPTITFASTAVKPGQGGTLAVQGDLTIRGTTRPITLTVEELLPAQTDPWGNRKRGATARASVNRKDFGLTWNVALEAGGVLVGEQIEIEIDVELVAAK